MPKSFKYRTAQGVWINDLRNEAFPDQEWPCVILDHQSVEDISANIRFLGENGFDSLTLFGLLTASNWQPEISKTVDEDRQRKVKKIIRVAKEAGIKILYGLGVYSWGFDSIIANDPEVQGTNSKVMCAAKPGSKAWMEKVCDYLLTEFDFGGFHLEAADLGRCSCEACKPKRNVEYFCDISAKTAEYLQKQKSDIILLANLCGYLPKGETVPRQDWVYFQKLSGQIDSLIDPGHFGTFIPPGERKEFAKKLSCAFGTAGGVWLYPPPRWNPLSYFIPYTQRSGAHLEKIYEIGSRAVEYNSGPLINPAVEVNVAFGGRKLKDVDGNSRGLLEEVVAELYQPRTTAAAKILTNLFIEAENAFFEALEPLYPEVSPPLGEIHLTTLFGTEPGPATYLAPSPKTKGHEWYLTKAMTAKARKVYQSRLDGSLHDLNRVATNIRDAKRLQRIQACLHSLI